MVGNNNLIDKTFLLDLIQKQIDDIPERYQGYRKDLFETICDIVQKERENMIQTSASTIRLDVKEIIDLNGESLNEHTA